jgi:branched-subunit amino acid transport protein AzlD
MDAIVVGIGILLAVSLLVRVVPAFVPLPISEDMAERIETVLPVAVFINLAAYCAVSEIGTEMLAGSVGVAALIALMPVLRRIGLVLVVVAATAAYLVARDYSGSIL